MMGSSIVQITGYSVLFRKDCFFDFFSNFLIRITGVSWRIFHGIYIVKSVMDLMNCAIQSPFHYSLYCLGAFFDEYTIMWPHLLKLYSKQIKPWLLKMFIGQFSFTDRTYKICASYHGKLCSVINVEKDFFIYYSILIKSGSLWFGRGMRSCVMRE